MRLNGLTLGVDRLALWLDRLALRLDLGCCLLRDNRLLCNDLSVRGRLRLNGLGLCWLTLNRLPLRPDGLAHLRDRLALRNNGLGGVRLGRCRHGLLLRGSNFSRIRRHSELRSAGP